MEPKDLDLLLRLVWMVLTTSAGLGVVTMVIVQLLKDLLPLRSMWQEGWIQAVVQEQAKKVGANPVRAMDDLINLATAGNARALYNLPIEQLAGQFNAAAQAVLDFPARHQDLLKVLAAGAEAEDLQRVLSQRPQARTMAAARAAGAPVSQEQEQGLVDFVDSRNRVAHQCQRNLDALQIAMVFRWKLILQIVSLIVGLACAVIVAWVLIGPPDGADWLAKVGVLGIIGGFLATVVRDLTAAIQNIKGRG